MYVCESPSQGHLTCANKRVKDDVILFDLSVVGHNEREPSIHTGVSYEVSVLHTVGANQFTLSIRYLVQKRIKMKSVQVQITPYFSNVNKWSNVSHPSAKVDVVWMLGDVVGVCAVIFQQTEDVVGALQAHCAFKWKILQSLVRKYLTFCTYTQAFKDAYTPHTFLFSHALVHSFPHSHTHLKYSHQSF